MRRAKPSNSGGARKNGGRPVGSKNKKFQVIAQDVGARGVTPLEVLLSAMRICWSRSAMSDHKNHYFEMALDCAERAAPYVHPKYASIEYRGETGGNINVIIRRFKPDPTPVIEATPVGEEIEPDEGSS